MSKLNKADIFGINVHNNTLAINYFDRAGTETKIAQKIIEFNTNCDACNEYDKLIHGLNINAKRYLFVINPVSGSGKAHKLFKSKIYHVMSNSFHKYCVIITENKHSIENYLKTVTNDLSAIVSVGGDGTTFDILQAMKKLHINIPLAIIPSGSGNGLSKSLTFLFGNKVSYNTYDNLYYLFNGTIRNLDTTLCVNNNNTYWSVLGQSWGLPSDIDIKSEYMRRIGSMRYTVQALIEFYRMKVYKGTIKYLPRSDENLQLVTSEGVSVLDKYSDKCECIQSNFNMLWACQVPYMSDDAYMAPSATMKDKTIYLVLIDAKSNISRYNLVRLFMNLESGHHADNPYVQIIPVVAYSLVTDPTENSILTIDGEKVNNEGIQVCIDNPIRFIF
jgi:sphingosine kinase